MGQSWLERPQDLHLRFLFTQMSLSVFCHISIPCARRITFVIASGGLLKINSFVLLGHAVRFASTHEANSTYSQWLTIPMAVLSKTWVYSRWSTAICVFESRSGHGWSSIVFVMYCVGSGPCDELIARTEEFYRFCVCVCVRESLIVCDLRASLMRRPWA